MTDTKGQRIIEGVLADGEFRQTNGQSFAGWLADHDREVEERLIGNLEVVGSYLVIRGAHEAEYPAGPEYGPYPYSDAAPIAELHEVAGMAEYTRAVEARAVRAAVASMTDLLECSGDTRWKKRLMDRADQIETNNLPLPRDLCQNREDHEPHDHYSETLGNFRCHADQSKRLPYYAEKLQKETAE